MTLHKLLFLAYCNKYTKTTRKTTWYHDKCPVLVDDLGLRHRRSVIVNDPVQPHNVRPRSQLTRYVNVALSYRRRCVHAAQHQHVYTE